MTDTNIFLPDWYQFDVDVKPTPKATIQNIFNLVDELKSQKLVSKWFYLYENSTVRLRFKSKDGKQLEQAVNTLITKNNLSISATLPFQPYWEDTATFPNLDILEAFANIMSEISKLNARKVKGEINHSNYTLVERLQHCIFNTVYGAPTEEYFLLKRLLQRLGSSLNNVADDPEQTLLDTNRKITALQNISLKIPKLIVPLKP